MAGRRKYVVEKDFYHKGLRCVVAFTSVGHRCGYVGVASTHSLYGKGYGDYLDIKKDDLPEDKTMSVIPLLGAIFDDDERVKIEGYFDCHGGITFSDGGCNSEYPVKSDLWWFGFDCAHCYDGGDVLSLEKYFPDEHKWFLPVYEDNHVWAMDEVIDECKKLAEQLAEFGE